MSSDTISQAERNRRIRFRTFMESYYSMRQWYLDLLESETLLYETEIEEFQQTVPPVTFKNYLIQTAGAPR